MTTLIYDAYSETIRTSPESYLVAVKHNDRFVLDLDRAIPMEFVTRFIKVWHSSFRYTSITKLIAHLNSAMGGDSSISIGARNVPLNSDGELNKTGIESALNASGELSKQYESFSAFHNIETGELRYWVDQTLAGSFLINQSYNQ